MAVRRSHHARARTVRAIAAAALLATGLPLLSALAIEPAGASPSGLVISEFRVRGPNGANDEFIEIANTGIDHTVASASGTGYGVAASDGTTRCSIPNGTIIPEFGHYLCVNSVGYSLAAYPAGNGTTATGDATYTTDIPDNAGIALFNNNTGGASYSVANVFDAVGSTSEVNTLYKEGTGYPALVPFSIDYSFYRNLTTGSITTFPLDTATPGLPEDTDNNASDFIFVDTNGTSAGAGQRLGAPGPENLSSPLASGLLDVGLLDPCVSELSPPNAVRDFTSDPANNSTFGTIDYRRTITNNTGGNVTRMRLRVADVRTFPAPSGIADMRSRTSTAVVVTVDRAPCGSGTSNVTVQGSTLEQPPSQPNGGGFNTSLSLGTVTLATPLANGATIDIRVLMGLQQTGTAGLRIIAEALPGDGTTPPVECLGGGGDLGNFCDAAPVGVADNYVTNEDTPLNVAAPGVLANDTDADTPPASLTAVLVTDVSNGTLALAADGSFTYTPDPDYSGPDSFTYKVDDGPNESPSTTVNLTVNAINDPPVGVNDNYAIAEDGSLVVAAGSGVLANDTDIEGDSLAVDLISITAPAFGTLIISTDGAFTYNPVANYNGPDSFTYQPTDGTVNGNVTTVNLTVTPVNDAPVSVGDVFATSEDVPLNAIAPGVLGNDSDVDGDGITAVLVSDVSDGTLALAADGSFTYTPDLNFNGSDSFTYMPNDGTVNGNISTVTINVAAVNDAPVAANDNYATPEDTPLVVAAPGVIGNDADVEGSGLTATIVTNGANGTAVLNPDGSLTYTPDADYNGPDLFTYTVSDGSATSNVATVNINVSAVNDAPVGVADAYTTTEDTPLVIAAPGVLANDSDADGDAITAGSVVGPTNGTLGVNADGSFTYTPDANFNGTDSFTYRASDGTLTSAPTTVTITVDADDDAPVAVADAYATNSTTPLVVAAPGVLTNDSDLDGDTMTAVLDTNVAHGTLALAADGSFTYTPNAGFGGTDSFTYHALAAGASSPIVTVTLTVTFLAPPTPPTGNTTFTVLPSNVVAGGTSEASGLGFMPGETVQLFLYGTSGAPIALGSALVNSSGSFTSTITVPLGTAVGNYTVVAFGADRIGTAPIVVTQTLAPTTQTGTLPVTGSELMPVVRLAGLLLLLGGVLLGATALRTRRFHRA